MPKNPIRFKPVPCWEFSNIRWETRPDILIESLNESSAKRVLVNVPCKNQRVFFFIDKPALVAALEQESNPIVPEIDVLGVTSLDVFKNFVEIGIRYLKEKMKMIVHQTIGK